MGDGLLVPLASYDGFGGDGAGPLACHEQPVTSTVTKIPPARRSWRRVVPTSIPRGYVLRGRARAAMLPRLTGEPGVGELGRCVR